MSPTLLDHPRVRAYLRQSFLISVPGAGAKVALTFDDGPNPRNTPRLLDVLAAHRTPATFFLLGRYVRRYRSLVQRIAEEGHEIGSHGNWHIPLPLLPRRLMLREILGGARRIEAVTGRRPQFYRPAMGWFNQQVIEALSEVGLRPVIGDVHPRDSRQPGTATIVQRVRERVGEGSIVILHDGGWRSRVNRSQTIEAVDRLIPELRERGFEFATLTGLLDEGEGATPPGV